MKLRDIMFGRTGGYYLFWSSAVYLVIGLTCALYYKEVPTEIVQICWILVLALPFLVPPIGRYFNMDVDWDRKMFGWRKKQIAEQVAKDVGNLPEPADQEVEVPVDEPKDEFDATESTYTIGKNKAGNTQLRMKLEYGSATLTMAPDAVAELVEQLAVTVRKQYKIEVTELMVEEKSNEVD